MYPLLRFVLQGGLLLLHIYDTTRETRQLAHLESRQLAAWNNLSRVWAFPFDRLLGHQFTYFIKFQSKTRTGKVCNQGRRVTTTKVRLMATHEVVRFMQGSGHATGMFSLSLVVIECVQRENTVSRRSAAQHHLETSAWLMLNHWVS